MFYLACLSCINKRLQVFSSNCVLFTRTFIQKVLYGLIPQNQASLERAKKKESVDLLVYII